MVNDSNTDANKPTCVTQHLILAPVDSAHDKAHADTPHKNMLCQLYFESRPSTHTPKGRGDNAD